MENLTSSSSSSERPPSRQDQPQPNPDPQQQTDSTVPSSSHDVSSSSPAQPPSPQVDAAAPSQQPSPTMASSAAAQNEAAPTTTLWENFMASLRNVVNRNPSESTHSGPQTATASNGNATDTAPAPTAPTTQAQQGTQATAQVESPSSNPTPSPGAVHEADNATDSSSLPRPPVLFRLPFNGPDGNPALLAFHPQPLPQRDSDRNNSDQQTSHNPSHAQRSSSFPPTTDSQAGAAPAPAAPQPPAQPSDNPGSTPANPHVFPHPEGHVPISPLFVPFGASPLPFSFIYDANTQTAWPIAQVTPGSPPGGPSPDAPASQQPRLVAGPPFRIILDIHFSAPPEPEQPIPEKAAQYVKQLERADVELRARMARLSMGSIGFADAASGDDQDALLGCGVCLDSYGAEDRPEWIDGQRSQDEAVVAVPCHGHHTLHAACLRDWLAKLPPSQWTCPFCRASLSPDPAQSSASTSSPQHPRAPKSALSASEPVRTTLREEVRARERQRGWRCDAPACFPRYPASGADDGHFELPETSDGMTTELVKLFPCRHEVHLDCLCTSMRVENALTDASELDAIMCSDDKQSDCAKAERAAVDIDDTEQSTVGKWVTCPTCRKEGWAELPLRRKPQRAPADVAAPQSAQKTSTELNAPGPSADDQSDAAPASVPTRDTDSTVENKLQRTAEAVGDGQEHTSDANASIVEDEEAVVDSMLTPRS